MSHCQSAKAGSEGRCVWIRGSIDIRCTAHGTAVGGCVDQPRKAGMEIGQNRADAPGSTHGRVGPRGAGSLAGGGE